jgi:UDP-N-acetylmuramoylalanine--D-glutamate ligase
VREELEPRVSEWRLAEAAHDLGEVDAIVVSPGVRRDDPRLLAAVRDGRPVLGELEMACRLVRGPIVAVTGTNGKSTTVSLLWKMFETAGRPARLLGNIGRAISEEVLDLGSDEPVVVEVSSFQLEWADSFHPCAAAVLNVAPDHLDRYDSFEDYARAKQNILRRLTADDFFVRPAHDARLATWSQTTPATTLCFGLEAEGDRGGAWVDADTVYVRDAHGVHSVLAVDEIPLLGAHNLQNVLAALALASSQGLGLDACAEAVRRFTALAHRAVDVPSADGIRWIDDSKATNVHAAMATASGLDELGCWLLGGSSKGEDFAPLREVASRARLVLCFGAEGARIARALEGAASVEVLPSLAAALEYLDERGPMGPNVLLSPACASFDEFRNFEHRGEFFARWVRERRGESA